MEQTLQYRLQLRRKKLEEIVDSTRDILNSGSVTETWLIGTKVRLKEILEKFDLELKDYTAKSKELDQTLTTDSIEFQMKAEETLLELDTLNQLHHMEETKRALKPQVQTRLPKLEVPKFDGKIIKWTEFWDRFEADVHSKDLPEVDKLSYLMGCLQGRAYETVEGIGKTNLNYNVAVDLLKSRFGSKRLVIDAHYQALYNLARATSNAAECRRTLNAIEKHLRVLQSLDESDEGSHLRITITNKFPENVIYQVNLRVGLDPTVRNIRDALDVIVMAMESSEPGTSQAEPTDVSPATTTESLHIRTETRGTTKRRREPPKESKSKKIPRRETCAFCGNGHYSDQCRTYITAKERRRKLGNKCYLCFKPGHAQNTCKAEVRCAHCGYRHNRALCFKMMKGSSSAVVKKKYSYVPKPSLVKDTMGNNGHDSGKLGNGPSAGGKSTPILNKIACYENTSTKGDSFLQTAVASTNGVPCRLLLDSGSQRSYITTKLAKKLKLTPDKDDTLMVYTFGSEKPKEIISPSVEVTVRTKRSVTRKLRVNIVPHIVQRLPVATIESHEKVDFFADDDTIGDTVDMLIGNDFYFSFMSKEYIKLKDYIYLVNSEFGWLISGNIFDSKDEHILSVITYCSSHQSGCPYYSEPDLPLRDIDMRFLWSLESIGIVDSPKTTREEEAVKTFNETTKYHNSRYEVKWPWIQYPPNLPTNYGLAYGRLKGLLKRSDAETLAEYNSILTDQLETGIIEVIEPKSPPSVQVSPPVHYLPHHMVKQSGKRGRLVYDASAKVKGEKSLNECMYSGPSMLEDLTGLLLKFRTGKIGITADVEKAFLQVALQEEDRDVTRFLWVKDPKKDLSDNNLIHLRFCRVPFGIISSPFLLTATIRFHMARTNSSLLLEVADKCYVDNLVLSIDSEKKALDLYKETRKVFEQVSMNIRDWQSNSLSFLAEIPNVHRAPQKEIVKVLGLMWNVKKDSLTLNVDKISDIETGNVKVTKKDVLRTIARLYDPCGFVAPVVLPAKLLFQELCSKKLKWETTLPENLYSKWLSALEYLQSSKDIEIPRYVGSEMPETEFNYELHCFCDASKDAYAAVVYLRMTNPNTTKTAFLMSKAKITPIENKDDLKIPRMELLACLIGNRLLKYVKDNLDIPVSRQTLWTDSEVVLAWIKSTKLLPPFVQRRVNEIKQSKEVEQRYVNTKANPADIATRPELWIQKQALWYHGPDFLVKEENSWPCNNIDQHTFCSVGEGPDALDTPELSDKNLDDMETWSMDYEDDHVVLLPETDKEDQSIISLKKLQMQYFPEEGTGKETHLSRNLGLYIDVDGILRCRGRMTNTSWTYDMKHPVLIPKECTFTTELIQKVHEKNFHVGVSHTLSILRQNYWIPQGRAQVQKVLRRCTQCVRHGGGPYRLPSTPALPAERANYSTPFTYVGMDYFGPLYVDTKGSKQKRWVCLFTCLAIRAVHLELVNDLTAEECLLALRRCIAARGLPKKIVSDNALYFKLVSEVLSAPYCKENGIQWKFIPQLAPWHGGFYERLVALVKNCLKRTLGKQLLNDHQIFTVIKEIETVINSRPLTCVGAELEHVLKPADFLSLGHCLTPLPTSDVCGTETHTKIDLISSWKKGHSMLEEFKRMFISQYLTSLREKYRHSCKQPRVKSHKSPQVGDIVQLKNDSRNRENWKVGKISSLVKGADGQCRVAKVKVGKMELTRSIGHLYPLEADADQPEDQAEYVNSLLPPHIHQNPPNLSENEQDLSVMDVALEENTLCTEKNVQEESPDMDIEQAPEQISLEEPPRPVPEVELVDDLFDTDIVRDHEVGQDLRPRRDAAIRARQKIAEWTRQLVILL